MLPAEIPANFPVANDGNFKVPGLRNVELTAPYFHNGGEMTLEGVIAFYTRGGNFPAANAASVDAGFQDLGALVGKQASVDALVAFMKSMTDERVRNHAAPFDHPELFVPNGAADFIKVAARDASGSVAASLGVTIAPVLTPTNSSSQLLTGTVAPGSTVTVTLDTPASAGAVTVSGGSWSAQLSGLVRGVNNVTVTATDQAGASGTATAAITLLTQPTLTLNPVLTPTGSDVQTISGTTEPGLTPVVLASAASVGPATLAAGGVNWSCTLTGLSAGANPITVLAVDTLGNVTVRTATVSFAPSDGDANLDGRIDVADALGSLRFTVGLVQPTAEQKLRADVSPLQNGKPAPDGALDLSDALLILRKVVGLVGF